MSALNAIPIEIRGIVVFLIACYTTYLLIFKVQPAARVATAAFVFWFFGMAAYAFMNFYQFGVAYQDLYMIVLHVVFVVWLILGYNTAYRNGDTHLRSRIKESTVNAGKVFLGLILFFAILVVLGKLGVIH